MTKMIIDFTFYCFNIFYLFMLGVPTCDRNKREMLIYVLVLEGIFFGKFGP